MNADFVISSWYEACIPLGHYTTYVGSCLLTFQDSSIFKGQAVQELRQEQVDSQYTGDGVSGDWFSGRKRSQSCSL